jgi:hypothetical protein
MTNVQLKLYTNQINYLRVKGDKGDKGDAGAGVSDISGFYTPLIDFNIHNHDTTISGAITKFWQVEVSGQSSGGTEPSGLYTPLSDFNAHNHNTITSGTVSKWIQDTGLVNPSGIYTLNTDFNSHNHDTTISGAITKFWQDKISGMYTLGSIGLTIDGAGSAISTGIKNYVTVPFNCTITSWDLLANNVGAIKIDVWKDTYANYPPTNEDSITNSNEPTIASGTIKNQSSTLTGWTTTSITNGDILAFNVDSCTDITRATLILKVLKQ